MNNNGYFGIPGNNYFGAGSALTTPSGVNSSSSAFSSKAMAGIGATGSIVSSALDIFAIGSENRRLESSKQQIQSMSNLQLMMIDAQKNLQNIESQKEARTLVGRQLAQASTSGASLSSASVLAANQQAYIADYNRRFINEMNATSAKFNTLFQKQKQLQSIYDTEESNQYRIGGDLINTAISATALALL